MPNYTVLTVIAVLAVIALELCWFRTGIFRTAQYWCAMVIVFAFQIPVDGWLTKLSGPIVIYDDRYNLDLRWPWDIPVEDFGFGFAMVTLAILLWNRATRAPNRQQPESAGSVQHDGAPQQQHNPTEEPR